MTNPSDIFLTKSREKAADLQHRKTINFNIGRYNASVPKGKSQFADVELARMNAKNKKWQALENLESNLLKFEEKLKSRGAKVVWAETGEQALQEIINICKERNCKSVVKSKSMVTEEIHLNAGLESNGIESVETDLGEYIQQLDGEGPYHIVTPAMHKSKEDVAKLFHEKLGTPADYTPEQLTLKAREILREKYVEAGVGVTGGNFLLADVGGIAVTENEGNARLSCAFPKTHVVVVGIEKMIPSINDLGLFWPLLSSFGTGQQVTVYNSIITGPRQKNETDGPEELIVILLDNGRTKILQDPIQRESLYCIRCGACLNACPIYKNIGGHAYGATYSGPIGSVITPHLQNMEEYKHLSFASSLCGNCTEVCAVKINLHELLLNNRKQSVDNGHGSFTEKMAWRAWRIASLRRGMMNLGNGKLKNLMVNKMFTAWTKTRSDLHFSQKTFNEMWRDREKSNSKKE